MASSVYYAVKYENVSNSKKNVSLRKITVASCHNDDCNWLYASITSCWKIAFRFFTKTFFIFLKKETFVNIRS